METVLEKRYWKYWKGTTQGYQVDKRNKKLSYEERLVVTNLTTLDDRRTRGDLIEVFKLLKGLSNVDYREFFKLSVNRKTRGHRMKIEKNRSKSNIRKYFFSQRVVNEWNKLPENVIEAESVNSFKNRYDKYKVRQNKERR